MLCDIRYGSVVVLYGWIDLLCILVYWHIDWSFFFFFVLFFFQAEDGIRDLVRSRGLGDVYKRQLYGLFEARNALRDEGYVLVTEGYMDVVALAQLGFPNAVATCLLYTSDAADERSSVDLGGRRIIKKKKIQDTHA